MHTMAAMNKCLALTNKPHTRVEATLPVFHHLGGAGGADAEHELADPDLYLSLCLFAGIAALLAIIYECIQRFCRRKSEQGDRPVYLKKARPLDGLLRGRPSPTALNKLRNHFRRRFTPGEVQQLEQRSRTRL
jgi:hypothetical protein